MSSLGRLFSAYAQHASSFEGSPNPLSFEALRAQRDQASVAGSRSVVSEAITTAQSMRALDPDKLKVSYPSVINVEKGPTAKDSSTEALNLDSELVERCSALLRNNSVVPKVFDKFVASPLRDAMSEFFNALCATRKCSVAEGLADFAASGKYPA